MFGLVKLESDLGQEDDPNFGVSEEIIILQHWLLHLRVSQELNKLQASWLLDSNTIVDNKASFAGDQGFCPSVHLNVFLPYFPKLDVQQIWDSEFLGRSDVKKWSHIWKLLLIKGVKSLRKNFFFCANFPLQSMAETTLPDGLETSDWRAYL